MAHVVSVGICLLFILNSPLHFGIPKFIIGFWFHPIIRAGLTVDDFATVCVITLLPFQRACRSQFGLALINHFVNPFIHSLTDQRALDAIVFCEISNEWHLVHIGAHIYTHPSGCKLIRQLTVGQKQLRQCYSIVLCIYLFDRSTVCFVSATGQVF